MRNLLLLFILVFFVFPLAAEDAPEETAAADALPVILGREDGIFPLALILEDIRFSTVNPGQWQPDWPVKIPPNAFAFSQFLSGRDAAVTVVFDDARYTVRRNGGLFDGFPLIFEGNMVQVYLEYNVTIDGSRRLRHIDINEDVSLEILEYDREFPFLIRVKRNDVYFFVILDHTRGRIYESWFNVYGNYLDSYDYILLPGFDERIRDFHSRSAIDAGRREFDSRLLVTEKINRTGVFSVHYINENLPRYWYRSAFNHYDDDIALPDNFIFQWDTRGFLTSISSSGINRMYSRFEYIFDGNGNWIEMQEIEMIFIDGLVVPAPGQIIRRTFEYGEINE